MRSSHTLFRPHFSLPLPFTLPLFSRSRLSRLSQANAYQHIAATMGQLYAPSLSHFSLPFIHSFTHHHRHPRGHRLLYKLELADKIPSMYKVCPPACSGGQSFSNQAVLNFYLFPFSAHLRALLSRRSSGGTAVPMFSANLSRSSCLSRHTYTHTHLLPFPFTLLFLDDTSTLAAPIFRYTCKWKLGEAEIKLNAEPWILRHFHR